MSNDINKPGRRTRRRRRNGERGQSLVEFVLTAPILIFTLLGMAELGNGLNAYLTIVNSARDAARLYAQGGATEAALRAMVDKETERLPGALPTSSEICTDNPGVCITTSGTPPASNAEVKVRVCYDHPVIIGIPVLLPGPIRMCSETTMRVAI